jgi:hypothetical protein
MFQQFVISGFPVSQYRCDLEARLDGEGERGFVLKPNVYGAIIRGKRQFHVGNDLAFGLWERENAPVGNFLSSTGAGNFIGSHDRLVSGDFGQGCFRAQTRKQPASTYSVAGSEDEMKNSATRN